MIIETEIPKVLAYCRLVDDWGRLLSYELMVICPYCGQEHSFEQDSRELPIRGTELGVRSAECGRGRYSMVVETAEPNPESTAFRPVVRLVGPGRR